ncbi:hypothetical protein CWB96_17950 [Pseudoalteromonas citrea]|uniref:Uncharacterized protein n=1 Tax=Pseudoalteromonas citrea TaxID=43655 RepID=A0A5S3XMY2_9GAMM|nr:hypothetical protein CWB97_15050 [Pseudoalteromonas citrea]TMP55123.1 hypothetical protein CWB96_17950 [Pseudoalteromonas citrea]
MEAATTVKYSSIVDQKIDIYVSEVLIETGCGVYLVRIEQNNEIEKAYMRYAFILTISQWHLLFINDV